MKQVFPDGIVRVLPWCLAIGALLVISCSFYLSLTLYSYFIIGRDEANFLLRSSIEIFSATNFQDILRHLFQTHGQHVLLGMQLANLLSFLIFGVLNFQFINFIGLLYLIIPACIVVQRFTGSKSSIGFFIPLTMAAMVFPLALSPGHLSCAINTACTGNHYLGLGLSILALSFFIDPKNTSASWARLLAAECLMTLAILSSPAALALVPVLLIPAYLHTQRLKVMLLHLLVSALVLMLYFFIAMPADFSLLANTSLADRLKLFILFVLFCFQLLGSVFFWPETLTATIVCVLLGAGITVTGLWLLRVRLIALQKNPSQLFFACGFLLMLGMVALIGLGRIGTAGSTRYVFYACFALVFLLGLWLLGEKTGSPKLLMVALLCLASYPLQLGLNAPYIERIRGEIRNCNERWLKEQQACGVMIKHSEATELLKEAERKGVLRLPRPPHL